MSFSEMKDQWPPLWPDNRHVDAEAVANCVRNDAWSRGLAISKFEQEFASFLGVRFVLAVSNATHALCIALEALGVGPGDEVVVPSLTWPSTAVSVLDCGATPILADIDPSTYCLDIDSFETKITGRTKAVVPVHLYCSAADMTQLGEICRKRGIYILEDAAHCHGARWGSQALGCIGQAGVFSFHEKKLLPCGEGGCIVTGDEELYARVHELRDHGTRPLNYTTDRQVITSGNNRMASFQAALLSSRLPYLNAIIQKEAENAEILKSELSNVEELCPIMSPDGVSLQTYYSFCWKLRSIKSAAFVQRAIINTQVKWSKPYVSLSRGFNRFCSGHPIGKARANNKADFKAPWAEKASEEEGVRFHHSVLLACKERIVWFGKMIRKTIDECYRNREFK